jgi:HK97 gp10 family phage protein
MSAEFNLDGFNQVMAALKKLDKELVSRKVITSAARRAAMPLVRDAQKRAPRFPYRRVDWYGRRKEIPAGALKNSIGIINARSSDDPGVKVGPRVGGKNRKWDGWFAHFVEFGTAGYTAKRGKLKGRFIPGQRAQPFMQPAYESTQPEVYEEFYNEILTVYNRITSKMK